MDILFEEHQKLLVSLLNNKVSFILIGGYAVIYYGYERVTGDMDIWLQPHNENMSKLLAALREFGIEESNLEQLSQIDLTTPQMFYVGDKPRRIDFLTKVTGINFNEAVLQANYFPLEGKQVPVIQYHHLILTKTATGRAKDKADIEELQRINKYKKE
jgi:predicted nucleotidyltransferase